MKRRRPGIPKQAGSVDYSEYTEQALNSAALLSRKLREDGDS